MEPYKKEFIEFMVDSGVLKIRRIHAKKAAANPLSS